MLLGRGLQAVADLSLRSSDTRYVVSCSITSLLPNTFDYHMFHCSLLIANLYSWCSCTEVTLLVWEMLRSTCKLQVPGAAVFWAAQLGTKCGFVFVQILMPQSDRHNNNSRSTGGRVTHELVRHDRLCVAGMSVAWQTLSQECQLELLFLIICHDNYHGNCEGTPCINSVEYRSSAPSCEWTPYTSS